jgi:hypothetical protein
MGDGTGIVGMRGQPRERGVEGGGIWRVRGDWKKREKRSDFIGWRPTLPPGKGIAPWGCWGDGAQASNAYIPPQGKRLPTLHIGIMWLGIVNLEGGGRRPPL